MCPTDGIHERGQSMDINEKFQKVLELQEQGVPRTEIYKICEWSSLDTLTRNMKKRGYVYDKFIEKYVQMTERGQVSPSEEEQEIAVTQSNAIIDLKNDVLKGNIVGLAKHYDEIMSLLTWYKAYGGQVSSNESQVIEVVEQGIKIDLPKSKSMKTSIRVNKEVWEQFGQFAELHNEFVKGDLLAQALKEYIERY